MRPPTEIGSPDGPLTEVLAATAWLDPGQEGDPYPVTVRFSGRRVGPIGKLSARDRFLQTEQFDVVPGSGPVSITTIVKGINAGDWTFDARVLHHAKARLAPPASGRGQGEGSNERRLRWPWTYRTMLARRSPTARTGLLPFATAPGVIPLAYATLVLCGILSGLAVQAFLLGQAGLEVKQAIQLSLVAALAGIVGAKLFFVIGHRGRRFNGWMIQGFIAGATVAAIIGASDLPMSLGTYLDSMAAGLLVGMAIGRIGCFFAGCCRGRPTRSRLGIWSSDQRVGARRIPTQLLEAMLAFVLGLTALVVSLIDLELEAGWLFVAALAAYTFARQFLLPLRADPRHLRYGRSAMLLASGVILVADAVWATGAVGV